MPAAVSLLLHRLPRALLPAACAGGTLLLNQLAWDWTLALWAAATLGLLGSAWLGEQLPGSGTNLRYVGALLATGAGLRAIGGALGAPRLAAAAALPVECYAADTLTGQRRRRWPPRAEALLSVLALPADSLLQHSLDGGLRHAG